MQNGQTNWLRDIQATQAELRGEHVDMSDIAQQTIIEHLRAELFDRVDAHPFDDWSPALLRALIAIFDFNGVTPLTQRTFRPHVVR